MVVGGSLLLSSSNSLVLSPNSTLTVQGVLQFSGTLSITLIPSSLSLSSRRQSQAVTQTVVVATYGSQTGQFNSIVPTSASACETVTSQQMTYGTTSATLSVTLSPNPNAPAGCPRASTVTTAAAGGLSTGAIVGIAVGSACAAIIAVVVIILITTKIRNRRNDEMFSAKRKSEIPMSRAYQKDE